MIIFGVESTCDETGAGVVKDGMIVLSNVVSSSARLHEKYKGIVPEIAAREQVKVIIPVIKESLSEAHLKINDLDVFAVAHGPGLIGSLIVGVETAKALCSIFDKPLIPVNHLIAHIYSNWLSDVIPEFPLIGLVISGGHTDLILMTGHGNYKWLGGTRDDAVGEVFDKVARILGFGYPGGPEIEKAASNWYKVNCKSTVSFPRPMINKNNFDFSFSGLKTSVVNYVSKNSVNYQLATEVAYQFQKSIADVLVSKTFRAAAKFNAKSVVVGGGVAANDFIRRSFATKFDQINIPVFFPKQNLSVDNGAMVAAAAFYQKSFISPLKLQAFPELHI